MIEELMVDLDGPTTQFIVVRLNNEQYGIDIQYVDNIVRIQHITRVPNVQNYIKGVINLRGEVIPVMSIGLKMELPTAEEFTKSTRIIILKLEQHGNIGIIVDEVREVVTLKESQIEKVAYESKDEKANFIFGIGKYGEENNGLISLLDLNAVILEKDSI